MRATPATSFQSDINVTPLIDVCLVLLSVFMVITPLLVTGVHVELPQTTTAHSASRVVGCQLSVVGRAGTTDNREPTTRARSARRYAVSRCSTREMIASSAT